jgi:hypothetical protein
MNHIQSRLRSVALAAGLAIVASTGFAATSASAATAGQLCASSKVGTKDGALTCTKDGSRFRWTASGGAAPSATKAPKTTKAPKSTRAASSPSPSPKAAPSAPGQPVNGRFCAKADSGKRGTDNKGQSLTCSADKNGRYRWQK